MMKHDDTNNGLSVLLYLLHGNALVRLRFIVLSIKNTLNIEAYLDSFKHLQQNF